MWKGFSNLLAYYYNDILDEWIKRGYKNTMQYIMVPPSVTEPLWLGNKDFHDSLNEALESVEYLKISETTREGR